MCLVLKFIYDLKQSPREWYQRLSNFLIDLDFQALKVNASLLVIQWLHISTLFLYMWLSRHPNRYHGRPPRANRTHWVERPHLWPFNLEYRKISHAPRKRTLNALVNNQRSHQLSYMPESLLLLVLFKYGSIKKI